jgi:hypothetical protein
MTGFLSRRPIRFRSDKQPSEEDTSEVLEIDDEGSRVIRK